MAHGVIVVLCVDVHVLDFDYVSYVSQMTVPDLVGPLLVTSCQDIPVTGH